MESKREHAVAALRQLKESLIEGGRRFPHLHRLTLRGDVVTVGDVKEYLIDAITRGRPHGEHRWSKPPYHIFYGANLPDGLPYFATLSKAAITLAVDGLNVLGDFRSYPDDAPLYGGIMPMFPVEDDEEAADNWVGWMEFLGRETGHPLVKAKEGPIESVAPPPVPNGGLRGFYDGLTSLFLPNGVGLQRFGMVTPTSTRENAAFAMIAESMGNGGIGDVTIFDHSLFTSAAFSIDLLIDRATVKGTERVPAPADRPAWTTATLNEELRRARMKPEYIELAKRVREGAQGAIKSAGDLWGRNKVAERKGCAVGLVSKCSQWHEIAEDLGLQHGKRAKGTAKTAKAGSKVDHAIALEQTADARESDPAAVLISKELETYIRAKLPGREAEATIERVRMKEQTEDEARQMVDVYVEEHPRSRKRS